jgi:hypothetical protein
MWLFTEHGFMSVVAHRDNAKLLLVRFRTRKDARAILDGLTSWERDTKRAAPKRKVISTPDADYPFRFIVGRERFANFLSASIRAGLRYTNFKSVVATVQGIERAETYHEIWSILRDDLDPRSDPGAENIRDELL